MWFKKLKEAAGEKWIWTGCVGVTWIGESDEFPPRTKEE